MTCQALFCCNAKSGGVRSVPEVVKMAEQIVIKKYGNRRLYDTRKSRYINLEDIPLLLKGGDDVKVVEAESGEDITSAVLLQIIVERERRKVEGLPVDLLKEFVVLQDTPGRKLFDQALRQSLALFREMKRAGALTAESLQMPLADPNFWWQKAMGAAEWLGGAARRATERSSPEAPGQEPPPAAAEAPAGERPATAEEAARPEPARDAASLLLDQLESLRKRLDRIERRQTGKKE
jgi:polyhydroxyalkanoate synthesis repressor PhaR